MSAAVRRIRERGLPGADGGADAGLSQIQAGMAWHFRRYAKQRLSPHRELYADTEAQARTERRGLWADAELGSRWDWRAAEEAKGIIRSAE